MPYDHTRSIGVIDGQVKFVSIGFTTTLLRLQPYAITKRVYDTSEAPP